jgi:hypothetical protein
MQSHLSEKEVHAEVDLPSRNQAKKIFFRARVPDGWRVIKAESGGKKLAVDDRGTVDLSGLRGTVSIRFSVARGRTAR